VYAPVIWWKPWTWNRIVRTVEASQFTRRDTLLMLALKEVEDIAGPHGIAMDVATDAANEFKFDVPDIPTVDHAARTLSQKQEAYYKRYDTKDAPVNRAGHLWSVTFNPDKVGGPVIPEDQ
jgi:hypothetical protein